MKIRRKFKGRSFKKFEDGGTDPNVHKTNVIKRDANGFPIGEPVNFPNSEGDAVNSFTTDGIPKSLFMPTPESVGSRNDTFLQTLENDLAISELDVKTAETDAFSKQLEQEQANSAREESATFNDIINNEGIVDPLAGIDTDPITNNKDNQLFNPFAGVDIPTAANIFGQSIGKDGDPLTAVASGFKLVAGLGRNITSGIGTANRNAFQKDELNKKLRESKISKPTALGEDGGKFGSDLEALFDKVQFPILGIEGEEKKNKGSKKTDKPLTKEELEELNKNKSTANFTDDTLNNLFERVNPNDEGAQKNVNLNLGKYKGLGYFDIKKNGDEVVINPTRRTAHTSDSYKQVISYLREQNPDIKIAKNNYIPLKDRPKLEDGGKLKEDEITGSIVRGTETGGESVELEKGEHIQEPEGTPKKVEGKTHEEGGEKMNLPGGTDVLSDNLKLSKQQAKTLEEEFEIKVGVKDTYAKALDKYNKKIGLTEVIEEETEVIKEIKKQKENAAEDGADSPTLNINLEFLSSKLKDLTDSKGALEQQSSEAFNKMFELQEDSKPKKEKKESQEEFNIGGTVYSKDQIIGIAREFGIDNNKAIDIIKSMADGGKTDRRDSLIQQARALGYEGDLNPDTVEQNIGDIQKFLADKNPQAVIDYFKNGIAITSKGVDIIRKSNPEVFKELGFDIKKEPSSFTEEQRKAIQGKAQEKGVVDDNFWLNQFQDGKWEFRFPQIPLDTPGIAGEVKIENPSIDVNISDLVAKKEAATDSNVPTAADTDPSVDTSKVDGKKDKSGFNALLLPENMPLPPQGLQLPAKFSRTFGKLDAERISPDQRLTELNRGVDAAMAQLDKLPSGQKEAAVLQLQANKQAQADKILQETNIVNNKIATNEDVFNIRQGDRQQDANVVDSTIFQDKAFAAIANTEADFRRFFNTVQERNTQNFSTINSLNLLNQTSDNFDFGNQGVSFTGGADISAEDLVKKAGFGKAVRISRAKNTTSTKKKKTSKKKRGGRIKKMS